MTLLCFRCDRRVDARPGFPCPNCGATLLAPPGRVTRSRASASEIERRVDPFPPRERRTVPIAGIVVIAALAALVIVPRAWQDASDVTPTPAEPHPGPVDRPVVEPLGGRLAYVAGDRVWVLDLATGSARRGPAVGDVVELVDLSAAHAGWLGIETTAAGGSRRALAFRALEPDAEPVALARGDRLAWGPGGGTLVVGTDSRSDDGCRDVAIDIVTVRTSAVERGRPSPDVCGPLLSLGRSSVATYFTAADVDGVDTFFTGTVGVPHLLFVDTRMVSASPVGQFLVTAPAERGRLGTAETLFLAWRGRGGPLPVRLGAEPLAPDRIVAWSPDGSLVALLGTAGRQAGLYVLRAGSGSTFREPAFVTADEVLDATFAPDGTLFVAGGGEVRTWRDGRLDTLALPRDAPNPAGPVVWLP